MINVVEKNMLTLLIQYKLKSFHNCFDKNQLDKQKKRRAGADGRTPSQVPKAVSRVAVSAGELPPLQGSEVTFTARPYSPVVLVLLLLLAFGWVAVS